MVKISDFHAFPEIEELIPKQCYSSLFMRWSLDEELNKKKYFNQSLQNAHLLIPYFAIHSSHKCILTTVLGLGERSKQNKKSIKCKYYVSVGRKATDKHTRNIKHGTRGEGGGKRHVF